MALLPELRGEGGIGEEETDLVGRPLHRMGQQAGVLVDHLQGNATHRRSHDRFLLPQGFRDGEAEPLPQAFLDDQGRGGLQGVNLDGTSGGQIQDMDVRITLRGLVHL